MSEDSIDDVNGSDVGSDFLSEEEEEQGDVLHLGSLAPSLVQSSRMDQSERLNMAPPLKSLWWLGVGGRSPSARWGCTLGAFGPSMLVFGGTTSSGPVADLYVFDSVRDSWQAARSASTVQPPPLYAAGAAAVAGRSLLVTGGRQSSSKLSAACFLLDVARLTWSRPIAPLPDGRCDHTVTPLDPALVAGQASGSPALGASAQAGTNSTTDRLLLLGGQGVRSSASNPVAMLIKFDSSATDPATGDKALPHWHSVYLRGPAAPSMARWGHSASRVSATELVVFGGTDGTNWFNDLVLVRLDDDGGQDSDPRPPRASCRALPMVGERPAGRRGHSAVLIGRRFLVIVGGTSATRVFADVHCADLLTLTWLPVATDPASGQQFTPFAPRYACAAAILGNYLVVFGGVGSGVWYRDLHKAKADAFLTASESCSMPLELWPVPEPPALASSGNAVGSRPGRRAKSPSRSRVRGKSPTDMRRGSSPPVDADSTGGGADRRTSADVDSTAGAGGRRKSVAGDSSSTSHHRKHLRRLRNKRLASDNGVVGDSSDRSELHMLKQQVEVLQAALGDPVTAAWHELCRAAAKDDADAISNVLARLPGPDARAALLRGTERNPPNSKGVSFSLTNAQGDGAGQAPTQMIAEHTSHGAAGGATDASGGGGAWIVRGGKIGRTVLHVAAAHCATNAVRLLLQTGADPLALDEAGRTPAAVAGELGHVTVERLLTEQVRDHFDKTTAGGPLNVSQLMMPSYAVGTVGSASSAALTAGLLPGAGSLGGAGSSGTTSAADLLLLGRGGGDRGVGRLEGLLTAGEEASAVAMASVAAVGMTDEVCLAAAVAAPGASDPLLPVTLGVRLYAAAAANSVKVLQMLVHPMAANGRQGPFHGSGSAVAPAASGPVGPTDDDLAVRRALLFSPVPRYQGRTALHAAAASGAAEALVWLLDQRPPTPDLRDINGRTPLLDALCAGHSQCTRLLESRGALLRNVGRRFGDKMHLPRDAAQAATGEGGPGSVSVSGGRRPGVGGGGARFDRGDHFDAGGGHDATAAVDDTRANMSATLMPGDWSGGVVTLFDHHGGSTPDGTRVDRQGGGARGVSERRQSSKTNSPMHNHQHHHPGHHSHQHQQHIASSAARQNLDAPEADGGAMAAALAAAAAMDDADTVRDLVRAGVSVELRCLDGCSAMHAAAAMGALNSMAALLEAGANPSPTDNWGHTPAALAWHYGQKEALRYLLRAQDDFVAELQPSFIITDQVLEFDSDDEETDGGGGGGGGGGGDDSFDSSDESGPMGSPTPSGGVGGQGPQLVGDGPGHGELPHPITSAKAQRFAHAESFDDLGVMDASHHRHTHHRSIRATTDTSSVEGGSDDEDEFDDRQFTCCRRLGKQRAEFHTLLRTLLMRLCGGDDPTIAGATADLSDGGGMSVDGGGGDELAVELSRGDGGRDPSAAAGGTSICWDYAEIYVWSASDHRSLDRCDAAEWVSPAASDGLWTYRAAARRLPDDATAGLPALLAARRRPIWLPGVDSAPATLSGGSRAVLRRRAGMRTGAALPLVDGPLCFGYVLLLSHQAHAHPTPSSLRWLATAAEAVQLQCSLLAARATLRGTAEAKRAYAATVARLLVNDGGGGGGGGFSLSGMAAGPLSGVCRELFDPVFQWATSTDSDDHHAAMAVLPAMIEAGAGVLEVYDRKILHALQFLSTVSPAVGPARPIKPAVDAALQRLVALRGPGFHVQSPPYFDGTTNPSPIFTLLHGHGKTVHNEFNASPFWPAVQSSLPLPVGNDHLQQQQQQQQQQPPPVFRSRDLFAMGVTATRGTRREAPRDVLNMVNEMLATAYHSKQPYVPTLADMLKLHTALSVDRGVQQGEFRSGYAVGSVNFYQFYRAFLPAEEIQPAIAYLLKRLQSARWLSRHPLERAFYFFSAFVYIIHPFEDANGRTGRIFANLMLKQYGFPVVFVSKLKILHVEDVLKLAVKNKK